jgi:hypothetical protein
MGLLDWNKMGPQGGDYSLLTEKDRRKNAMMAANQGFMAMMEADRRGLPGIQSLGAFGGAMAPAMQAFSEQSKEKRVDERDKAAWKAIAEADPNMPQYMKTALETGDMATFRALGPSYMASQNRKPMDNWVKEKEEAGGTWFRETNTNKPLFIKKGSPLMDAMTKMIEGQQGLMTNMLAKGNLPKGYAEESIAARQRAKDLRIQLRTSEEIYQLGEEIGWDTGKVPAVLGKIYPYIRDVPVLKGLAPDDLTEAEVMQAWDSKVTEMAVQLTKDYKGAISNREIEMFLRAQMRPSDEPGAIKRKISMVQIAAEYGEKYAMEEQKAMREGIAAVDKFDEKWAEINNMSIAELADEGIISQRTYRRYLDIYGPGGAAVPAPAEPVSIQPGEIEVIIE